MPHKILIIKLGYSEVLDSKIDTVCSLGDVFWTTSVLHRFKSEHVTWLTDAAAAPLLSGNPYIKRIIVFDLISMLQLLSERFDVVVNFEKVPGICAFADKIPAWTRYGFRFDTETGAAKAYEHSGNALYISHSAKRRRSCTKSAMEIFYEMVGETYQGESYILGYKPKSKESFDIGFNTKVGKKWPNKAWPDDKWQELAGLIKGRYSYDLQKGLNDLNEYMEWIHSCRLLVTNDSLGLHLALAMRKKVVALFGPMPAGMIHDVPGYLAKCTAPRNKFSCMPCLSGICTNKTFCMESIKPVDVLNEIEHLLPIRKKK